MNPWIDFLRARGAQFNEDNLTHFSNIGNERVLQQKGILLCPLLDYALIAAHGPDTATFLQGQLSNDIGSVTPSLSQLSAFNSAKGRVLALFRIFRLADTYYLRVDKSLSQAMLKRLRMFVLRSNVKLESADDRMMALGVAGDDVENILAKHFQNLPKTANACVVEDQTALIRLHDKTPRFEVYAPFAQLQSLWEKLSAEASPVAPEIWRWLNIVNGVPEIVAATSDEFVLQMINLHALDGVSFTKGCYTGQEIVARMHYLGRLKKRMYRAHIDSKAMALPGTDIFEVQTGNTQSVGKIVVCAPSPVSGHDATAVLQVASVESSHQLRLGAPDGPTLEIHPLPYEVPLERVAT